MTMVLMQVPLGQKQEMSIVIRASKDQSFG